MDKNIRTHVFKSSELAGYSFSCLIYYQFYEENLYMIFTKYKKL